MKKILILCGITIFVVSSFYFLFNREGDILGTRKSDIGVITPTSFVMPENTVEVTSGGNTFWATYIKVEDPEKIFLYPNFENKENSRNLIEKNKCRNLINGSYYTGDSKPLGMFVSEGATVKNQTKNLLIPAIFFVTYDKEADILYDIAGKNLRLALQTGPVLWENGVAKRLSLRDDGLSRRSVVGITDNKEIIFIALYNNQVLLQGPYLEDMPIILKQFQEKSAIQLIKAANLDGGSASAFYTGKFFLEELSYIGSYFCIL